MPTSYIPSHFAADTQAAHAVMAANPFATFITVHGGDVFATQIPMLLRADGVLVGHMARANPHSAALWAETADIKATIQFTGVNGYVSPAWYAVNTGVPTWNYQTAQAQGVVRVLRGEQKTESVVKALIDAFDAQPELVKQAWADSPAQAQSAQLGAIVAFEVHLTQLEAKNKYSQNRPLADRHRVIAALERGTRNDACLAQAMKTALPSS